MENQIFINLPYNIRNEGKQLGAKYNSQKKSWYILNSDDIKKFEMVELSIPYEKKDIAKAYGGIFIKETKCWCTPQFNVDNINNMIKQ
jgi:hypothetical protein